MSTDALVAFLRARLDEDEQAARAAEEETGPRWEDNGFGVFILGTAQPIAVGRHDGCVPDDARAHMVRHNPARVLAEVDAKQRIIADHRGSGVTCPRCSLGAEDGQVVYWRDPCHTLRLLALPYRDHPGYKPEWAPEA